MSAKLLTCEVVRELLSYDKETGEFTWRVRPNGRVPAGSKAGSINGTTGYSHIKVFGRSYASHRLAWLHVHGAWPVGEIDHINGKKADNRLTNLRDVSREVNMQNFTRPHSSNKTGVIGVRASSSSPGRFEASIQRFKKRRHLGVFATISEAAAARMAAEAGCIAKERT